MPPHAWFSAHPPLAWDGICEAGKHFQPRRRSKGHRDPKGHIPPGDSEDWEGQSKKSATHMVSPIRLCFLEEVLLPLKCLKLCEAFASWNSLFAPVFLLTQIPSLIELITPL